MLTVWNIIPAIVLCKCKKGEMMWVIFELGCKLSVELAKYHELTVLEVIAHGIFAQKVELLAVRHPFMANTRTKLAHIYEHFVNYT